MEQHVNMQFPVKLGKPASETYDLFKKKYADMGDLSCTQIFEGLNDLRDIRSGCRQPTSQTTVHVKIGLKTSKKSELI